jgi:hypothetical protein
MGCFLMLPAISPSKLWDRLCRTELTMGQLRLAYMAPDLHFWGARERNRTADLRITRPGTYVRSEAVVSLIVSPFPLRRKGFLDDTATSRDGSNPLGTGLVGPILD